MIKDSKYDIDDIISLMQEKGYNIISYKKANPFISFRFSCLIHDLHQSGFMTINEESKKIIKNADYESTIIIFKDNYKFKNLPKNYKKIDNYIHCELSFLKEEKGIKLKSLVELNNELCESLEELKKWAKRLPKIN